MAAKAYVYADDDGEPWAILMDGHVAERHFLACARAIAKREGVKVDPNEIEHTYIRQEDEGDTPWHFCKGSQKGAQPVTCIRQPEMID